MKKYALIITLLIVSLISALGQTSNDSIVVKKVFGGYQYYQGGSLMNMNMLMDAMKGNELAYSQIKSAKSVYAMSFIFNYAGGFLVGWPLGTAIGDGEPNWTLAAIGAGLIAIGIPINQSFNRKARLAVDTYNNGIRTSSLWDDTELNLSMSENGIGFTLRF